MDCRAWFAMTGTGASQWRGLDLEAGPWSVVWGVEYHQVFGLRALYGCQRNALIQRDKHATVFHRKCQ